MGDLSVRREVPEAYESKPDSDEPWRYVCPDCEGQIKSASRIGHYECHNCDSLTKRDDLKDLKA
jgi:tRNA(Ile2) C34 agmatinyltransferase TiaS